MCPLKIEEKHSDERARVAERLVAEISKNCLFKTTCDREAVTFIQE